MSDKVDLLSLTAGEMEEFIVSLGEAKFRAKQVYEWVVKGNDIPEMTNLSASLRAKLAQHAYVSRVTTVVHQKSKDGTEKFLFAFPDGQNSECVLMRYHHGNSACISTQSGCRMGCAFCASTRGGLIRDLTPGEMLAEIYGIMRESGERVSSIVLMGTGEPLDNMDNVEKFISLITAEKGLNLGARHISLSTCGLCPKIDMLADKKLQITLSVSLHAPNNKKRDQIMPVNKAYPVEELMKSCKRYFDVTGRRISFEYAMIRGFNDTRADAIELANLLRNMHAHVNLIPLNYVKESPFMPSTREDVDAFCEELGKRNINVTVRRRLGSDIDAACGQLRANQNKG